MDLKLHNVTHTHAKGHQLDCKGDLNLLGFRVWPLHLALNYLTGVLDWTICHEAHWMEEGLVWCTN